MSIMNRIAKKAASKISSAKEIAITGAQSLAMYSSYKLGKYIAENTDKMTGALAGTAIAMQTVPGARHLVEGTIAMVSSFKVGLEEGATEKSEDPGEGTSEVKTEEAPVETDHEVFDDTTPPEGLVP